MGEVVVVVEGEVGVGKAWVEGEGEREEGGEGGRRVERE